jgi:hypothetical protein
MAKFICQTGTYDLVFSVRLRNGLNDVIVGVMDVKKRKRPLCYKEEFVPIKKGRQVDSGAR